MSAECALFQAALQFGPPWQVVRVEFPPESEELHLYLDFPARTRFACGACGEECSVYDSEPERTWRHLNFWQYPTFLHARLPRTRCATCGVRTVRVPWARPESGFTLCFEAMVVLLRRRMPMTQVAHLLQEHDTRLWRPLLHWVEEAQAARDCSAVRCLGIDDTVGRSGYLHPRDPEQNLPAPAAAAASPPGEPSGSAPTVGAPAPAAENSESGARGRRFVSLLVDHATGALLQVAPGRNQGAVQGLVEAFKRSGGQPAAVQAVTLDFSGVYLGAIQRAFPQADAVFDHFHAQGLLLEALETVRRQETKHCPELKRTRWLWLRNPEELSPKGRARLQTLLETDLKTAAMYRWVQEMKATWDQSGRDAARKHLARTLGKVRSTSPAAMLKVAETFRTHTRGILNYFEDYGGEEKRLSNGALEGLASRLKTMKAQARGFRTLRYFTATALLIAGQLSLGLPSVEPA